MEKSTVIAIMAKQPRKGFSKTRLCPPFSPQQAADLYEALLLDTIDLVSNISRVQLALAYTPAASEGYFKDVTNSGTMLIPVDGVDIGDCLINTTEQLFSSGFKQVIALNSDGPTLPVEFLLQAINELENHDVVLGPGEDGGYYLVGLKKSIPQIFQRIRWSTSQVLEQTLKKTDELGLKLKQTPVWYDVDTIEEVRRLENELNSLPLDKLNHTRQFFKQNPDKDWCSK